MEGIINEIRFIIKPGLPEGRSDQGGRAVELGGGYIS